MQPIGKRRWAIAEGYIPGSSTGEGRALKSHETACILNAGAAHAASSLRRPSRQAELALLSSVAYAQD